MKKFRLCSFLLGIMTSLVVAAQENLPRYVVEPLHPSRMELFDLKDIRITSGRMKQIQELSHQYLLTLEPDRLLAWFRREAGLTPLAQPYPQWESILNNNWGLPGHIMGFYLSGMSMMYQSTGDEAIRERLRYAIHGLREAQEAGGDGYVAATCMGRHAFEDVVSGNFTTSNPNINEWWEPVYVLNKITFGLHDAYMLCGIEEARTVLVDLANWFGTQVIDKLDHENMQKLLVCEHGSINESYVVIYRITGDKRYLKWAEQLNDEDMWVPLSQGKDILQGWHANTQIPKFTGFVAVGRNNDDKRMLDAAQLFFDIVVKNHTWVNGGNSCGEHFFSEDEYLSRVESEGGPESCNSVNMMRLTEALYQLDGRMSRVDYYERVLMNHILGNYETEVGMSCYYTSMRPGQYKVFADPYGCFWCCVGTGLQAPAKLAQMTYAHHEDTLFVNMFTPSTVSWKEKGIMLEQQTNYPDKDQSTILVKKAGKTHLAMRYPYWVEPGSMTVKVNGKKQSLRRPVGQDKSCYVTLKRIEWQEGDRIDITFRPRLEVKPLKKFDQYVSIQYGAMVMAQKIDNHGLKHNNFVSTDAVARKTIPQSQVTTLVGGIPDLKKGIRRKESDQLTLSCKTGPQMDEIELIPFSRILMDRYEVYFPRVDSPDQLPSAKNAAEKTIQCERRQIDRVIIGDSKSETGHKMESLRSSTGEFLGLTWRHASNGGYFMYLMKCSPDEPMSLLMRYRQDDSGARLFDVQVDGRTVKTENHCEAMQGVEAPLYYVEIPIPIELTRGKNSITVKLNAHNHNFAGGLFDLRVLKQK